MLNLDAAFATFPVLETERLTLRALTPEDADTVFRIMGDPQVMRYFGSPPMKTRDDAVRRIAGIAADFAERAGIRWGIEERASGLLVGSGGFWRIDTTHQRAEIGYELAPEHWGKGVMTEAIGVMLDFGFTVLRLHSVEAQIHPANTGSQRVLEKLGFVREGYFRESYYDPNEQRFTDTAVYSLLRP
jgi:ribosomal-protein-alanine N-acetyltransferase